jgi:HEAT repeat protein
MGLLADSDSRVRSRAIDALSGLGAREAIPQIMGLLADSASEVRSSAIYALKESGDEEAVDLLKPLVNHKNTEVSVAASEIREFLKRKLRLPKDR